MENLNMNQLLQRDEEVLKIKTLLHDFEENKTNILMKRGIYIHGLPGSGKTTFVNHILKELGYDIVKYDAGDVRNKSIIDTITKDNMSHRSILSILKKNTRRIAVVMDEIDGMNNGDKGGINSLIKIIRPKKTKKQRLEETTLNPIICIGNYHMDKKIKELMKVCHVIELKPPTCQQISRIFEKLMPDNWVHRDKQAKDNILQYVQGDLRKLTLMFQLSKKNGTMLNNPEILQHIFLKKSYNDDTREITKQAMNHPCGIHEHTTIMNETDRTIVGLLWHENIIDLLGKVKKEESIPLYLQMLDNICFADYIDRITFQKQIWQFNEMSSLIKTFKNNMIFHKEFMSRHNYKYNPSEVRFTKVLTKYSTEYNNSIFIQTLSQELGMDKNDMFAFFLELRSKQLNESNLKALFENYDICQKDIDRIYRYIDKYIKENVCDENEDDNDNDV